MNVRDAIRERLILLSQDGCSAEGEITLPPDFPGFQGHFPVSRLFRESARFRSWRNLRSWRPENRSGCGGCPAPSFFRRSSRVRRCGSCLSGPADR